MPDKPEPARLENVPEGPAHRVCVFIFRLGTQGNKAISPDPIGRRAGREEIPWRVNLCGVSKKSCPIAVIGPSEPPAKASLGTDSLPKWIEL